MKIKKTIIWLMLFLFLLPIAGFGESAISTYIGGLFHRYTESYLLTGVTFATTLQEQMELDIGLDFGIRTSTDDAGAVSPKFFIPIDVGLNFTFPGAIFSFYVGPGLSPAIVADPDETPSVSFYIGPFVKAGMRISVHAVMSVIIEVQQDLMIGGPNWVNTNTRVLGGISFSL